MSHLTVTLSTEQIIGTIESCMEELDNINAFLDDAEHEGERGAAGVREMHFEMANRIIQLEDVIIGAVAYLKETNDATGFEDKPQLHALRMVAAKIEERRGHPESA